MSVSSLFYLFNDQYFFEKICKDQIFRRHTDLSHITVLYYGRCHYAIAYSITILLYICIHNQSFSYKMSVVEVTKIGYMCQTQKYTFLCKVMILFAQLFIILNVHILHKPFSLTWRCHDKYFTIQLFSQKKSLNRNILSSFFNFQELPKMDLNCTWTK